MDNYIKRTSAGDRRLFKNRGDVVRASCVEGRIFPGPAERNYRFHQDRKN